MPAPKTIKVKVIPNASKNEIVGWLDKETLKIKLTAPPVDGRANEALIKFLAEEFGLKKSQIKIVRGQTSRLKVIAVEGQIPK